MRSNSDYGLERFVRAAHKMLNDPARYGVNILDVYLSVWSNEAAIESSQNIARQAAERGYIVIKKNSQMIDSVTPSGLEFIGITNAG
ncbi:hypothetical protein Psta_0448 [Pirellula staleyi DSM 6068]|uniref:Uncharacterized protein n=1 Tax=Pirellula staleyi (strain ATCC 27377 / DSM 6068 / ICPB 4128) TaxID=530564 RepID=D2R3A5_PIRSD|nr:hypothetical protein [Pirellula staleyi]ADB15136.1 hypothetical protein Psta_0448 [Pirellula staleyi DSM 6068]